MRIRTKQTLRVLFAVLALTWLGAVTIGVPALQKQIRGRRALLSVVDGKRRSGVFNMRYREKRALDLFITIPALIALAPLLLVIALVVRVQLGAPILFRQQRPGLHGKPFNMFKFRTMTDQRDADGRLLPDAERLTAFGRFLRSTSLDELPELFNVLRGDMSLVGPRPLLIQYLDRYTPEQARRHEVKPGITGWAQINGRNAVSWEAKFAYDVWYVDHRSLLLDLKIMAMTANKVLKREGISQEGHATMSEFLGTQAPTSEQAEPNPWRSGCAPLQSC